VVSDETTSMVEKHLLLMKMVLETHGHLTALKMSLSSSIV